MQCEREGALRDRERERKKRFVSLFILLASLSLSLSHTQLSPLSLSSHRSLPLSLSPSLSFPHFHQQDVFVSTLHAMFYGIVHDKFEIEGERDPPQARRWETICSLPEHVAQGLENRDEFYWVDGLRDIRRREAADAAAAAAGTATGTVTAAAAAAAAAAPAATAATE